VSLSSFKSRALDYRQQPGLESPAGRHLQSPEIYFQSLPLKSVELSVDCVESWLELWLASGLLQVANDWPLDCVYRSEIPGTTM
ncbi:hypothetical protein BGZ93_003904, partial [Podila epicladia]